MCKTSGYTINYECRSGSPDGCFDITELHDNLHYSYTKTSSIRESSVFHPVVDGIYKLENGMFFQKVDKTTPPRKGFMRMPGMQTLRLGLSSHMTVGDPLTGSGAWLLVEYAKITSSPPHHAQFSRLGGEDGLVAFVDTKQDDIFLYKRREKTADGVRGHHADHSKIPVWISTRARMLRDQSL